jgi:hypothetical protein
MTAMVAGVGLTAFDMIFGYWANGIRIIGAPRESVTGRGDSAGLIMAIVGVVFVLAFTIFLTCCELASRLLYYTDDL